MSKNNTKKRFALSLDPIHIGTGGYRLGRVDNTIVREPGTNIPKIPGTTIEGAARTYSYYNSLKNGKKSMKVACAVGKKTDEKDPCGACDICTTYGYTTEDKSSSGKVNFTDARILFFPVHSMIGPVWITSPMILNEFENGKAVGKDKVRTNLIDKNKKINLGWLYLENEEKGEIIENGQFEDVNKEIKDRIVLISDKLFSQVVNSNLEVRTSVSINPETGAAESGALFTYEAIPRATVFWFDVIYDKYKNGDQKVKETVQNGLEMFETLGVGGMSSRGFGRLRVLKLNGD